jgi:hypothetical protein
VEKKGEKIARVKYWENIADKLSKGGWSWSDISAIDSCGRTRVLLKLASGAPFNKRADAED